MDIFIKTTGSDFQKRVADILNSPLLSLDNTYIKNNAEILFTENQTAVNPTNLRHSPKPKSSIQRSLLDSTMRNLSVLLNKTQPTLDFGGKKHYHKLFGFNESNYHIANIETNSEYKLDMNSPKFNINKKYKSVISINSLFLIENIRACIDNIIGVLDKDGIAILDFIGQTYWYHGPDGQHCHTFNPTQINNLIDNQLNFVIVPIGNTYLASLNYFIKTNLFLKKHWKLRRLIRKILMNIFSRTKNPNTAIHYLLVGMKK